MVCTSPSAIHNAGLFVTVFNPTSRFKSDISSCCSSICFWKASTDLKLSTHSESVFALLLHLKVSLDPLYFQVSQSRNIYIPEIKWALHIHECLLGSYPSRHTAAFQRSLLTWSLGKQKNLTFLSFLHQLVHPTAQEFAGILLTDHEI